MSDHKYIKWTGDNLYQEVVDFLKKNKIEDGKKEKLTCYHEPISVDKIPVPEMKGFYYCPICGKVSYYMGEEGE